MKLALSFKFYSLCLAVLMLVACAATANAGIPPQALDAAVDTVFAEPMRADQVAVGEIRAEQVPAGVSVATAVSRVDVAPAVWSPRALRFALAMDTAASSSPTPLISFGAS